MTKRIHLISGPRNISTALMYSFGNRKDCTIIDEPMYSVYLTKHNVDHPGKAETLASLSSNIEEVKNHVILAPYSSELLFIKNMAHHFIGVDHRFIYDLENVFLIRNPKQLIASFAQVIHTPTIQDIGLEKEFHLFQDILSKNGKPPVVLDSGILLQNPKAILQSLCTALGIPFLESMLSWEAGPRKEDGVWAKYWYANVHKSIGFSKQKTSSQELPYHLEELYLQAKVYYDKLFEYAIRS